MDRGYYFHYTSVVAAQMVIAAGWLRPLGGAVYLTDELFASGSDAARILAIPVIGPTLAVSSGLMSLTKPVEMVCCIPEIALDERLLIGPQVVDPFRDFSTGATLYVGGGRQFLYSGEIEIRGLPWLTLGRP